MISYTAGRFKAWDDAGVMLVTGRVYTYTAGTTTLKNAFTSSTLATPATYTSDGLGGSYIALNARGEAEFWLGSGLYDIVLKTAAGATIWQASNQSNDFASVSAFMATVLDDTTAAAARTTLGAAGSGANADITSLTGLTTPVSMIVLRSYLAGCTLSTAGASATMSIAAGSATDSTNAYLMNLTAIAKTTSAWAVGTAAGGLDTGAIANSTWYHFYVIRRPDTGVVDVCESTSASAPTFGGNIPAAYTQYRRIGSGKTNGSAQWTSFSQNGDEFWLAAPVQTSSSGTNPGTASLTHTVETPLGIVTRAILNATLGVGSGAAADCGAYIRPLTATDTSPSSTAAPGSQLTCIRQAASVFQSTQLQIMTNTTQGVGVRLSASDGQTVFYMRTEGWIDTRGQTA